MTSWTMYWGSCKSRLSAIGRSCYLSRVVWRGRFRKVQAALAEEQAARAQCQARQEALERENEQLRARLRESERENERAKASGKRELPLGTPAFGQTYPVGLVVLCVNLARKVGLRPTVSVLEVLYEWLNLPGPIPSYQSIRGWMQRIGLDRMQRAPRVDDAIWLVDHTNQIGTEKVLTILRVRRSRLPPKGTSLRHEDVEPICCQPGTQWKREDVQPVYEKVAQQYGQPISILSDGAVELREPAEMLKNKGKAPLVIRDLKHYLANRLEALLTPCPQWQEFMAQVGRTRANVQQTELAHFTPPSFKPKARFMNLRPTLQWAMMIVWHLNHALSRARQGITLERLESKLGWLRPFECWINQWQECQQVISAALTFFNKNGVFRGSAKKFRRKIAGKLQSALSRQLLKEAIQFIRSIEKKLASGQRMPISTEILESTFALYKQLEQQHSKGGFTSLLPAFATLLKPTTREEVIASFGRVKVADVKRWLKDNLSVTLASRRQTAYREARGKKKTKRATQVTAAA